jgi:glutathione S-transferase
MITVWGEGRGFRVIWLLEEMGLPYRLRDVDLLAGVENDPEFLAINPSGFIPALQDGETVIVESVAIMQYLLAKYGPSPLAPAPADPIFADYLQFLVMAEAGLMGPLFFRFAAYAFLPEAEKDNATGALGLELFNSRMKLVLRQLARAPYIAGDRFTAADVAMTYTLDWAARQHHYRPGELEQAYIARTTAREGYKRAMQACHATRGWVESMASN